ncbi:hypothetical protein [Micromonospora haikouensis]|uniref:hypothetical protein n=1 Tax=Micromonospora haikouensis TaxID=686309 RepID=UPI003D70FC7C
MTALIGLAPRPVPAAEAVEARRPAGNGMIATLLITAASIALVVCVPVLRHWFMVPTTLAGILIGTEAVRWFRRGTDVFEPRACTGLLGLQFLYIAPILQVATDAWSVGIYDPPVWRDALGALAILNVVGLGIYRVILTLPRRPRSRPRRVRSMHMPTFYAAGLALTVASILAFCYEIAMFGGVGGFVAAMSDRINPVKMDGMGALIILAESFPTIAFALALVRWRRALRKHTALLVLLICAMTLTQFFIGGLKGSRSSTLWPVLLALVLVHVVLRQVSRKALAIVAALMLAFIYIYAFFKVGGIEAIDEIRETGSIHSAEKDTGRDLPAMLTGDLGRADIQSVVLYRYLNGEFEPMLGETYLYGFTMFVPDALLPVVPEGKIGIGSRILYNPLYERGEGFASKIYGMTGEGIINFGLAGGVLSFVAFGLVIRALQSYYTAASQSPELAPKLIAPMLWALVNINGADLDNILFFMTKYAMPLILLALLAQQFGRYRQETKPVLGMRR